MASPSSATRHPRAEGADDGGRPREAKVYGASVWTSGLPSGLVDELVGEQALPVGPGGNGEERAKTLGPAGGGDWRGRCA